MPEGPSEHSSRAESGEIATSTLAEVYAQQGLLGRALAIYRRMLSRAPDDSGIADRIESLERRIVEAGEEESPLAETPEIVAEPPELVEAGVVPATPSSSSPRERLPWDPPEEAEESAQRSGEDEAPPATIRPIDPDAFEAWLKDR